MACGEGTIAVPGDASCRELVACGGGTWGDIPRDADTQHVDASYAGGDSDGSEQKPWSRVEDAVTAAAPGAIVAIAAGSYQEALTLVFRPVRLWGRCPAMVEIVGPANGAPVRVLGGAVGSEIRALALTGDGRGLEVLGSTGVRVQDVWIHDTTLLGLSVGDTATGVELSVSNTRIERSHDLGILVHGATLRFEHSAIRDVQPRGSDGLFGGGIEIQNGFDSDVRSQVTLAGALIERSHDVAILQRASDLVIENSVIRDTLPASDGRYGRALDVEDAPDRLDGHATASVTASVFELSRDLGVLVAGSDFVFERSVVRRTLPSEFDQRFGRGMQLQDRPETSRRGIVTVRESLIDDGYDVGVIVSNAELTLTASLLRGVRARASDGLFGDGLVVTDAVEAQQSALTPEGTARVERSWIARNDRAGIASFGGEVALTTTVVDCNGLSLNGAKQQGRPFEFQDLGANQCGCGEAREGCKVLTTELELPVPID
jgi:hypothetical protein